MDPDDPKPSKYWSFWKKSYFLHIIEEIIITTIGKNYVSAIKIALLAPI